MAFNIENIISNFSNNWDNFKKEVMAAFKGISSELNNIEATISDNADGFVANFSVNSNTTEGIIVHAIDLPKKNYSVIDCLFVTSGNSASQGRMKIFPKNKGANNFIIYNIEGTQYYDKASYSNGTVSFNGLGYNDSDWTFKFEIEENKLNIYYVSNTATNGTVVSINVNISGCCFR